MVQHPATTAPDSSYDIIVTERNSRFYLRIPELNLIVDGPDMVTAHAALDATRRSLAERHAALGQSLPLPRDVRVRRDLFERVMPFLIKTAAVTVACSVLIISSAVAVNYALREQLRHAAQMAAATAVLQITAGLEEFAKRDLTPEREERLRQALRGVVPVLRPLIQESAPLFQDGTGTHRP